MAPSIAPPPGRPRARRRRRPGPARPRPGPRSPRPDAVPRPRRGAPPARLAARADLAARGGARRRVGLLVGPARRRGVPARRHHDDPGHRHRPRGRRPARGDRRLGPARHRRQVPDGRRAKGCRRGSPSRPTRCLAETEALARRWHGARGGRIRYVLNPALRALLLGAAARGRRRARRAPRPARCTPTPSSSATRPRRCARLKGGRDEIELFARPRPARSRPAHRPRRLAAARATDASLARRRFSVVHCPGSNLKLGSGHRARRARSARAGIPVGIGADGPPCNNRLDAWEEIRLASRLQALREGPGALGGLARCGSRPRRARARSDSSARSARSSPARRPISWWSTSTRPELVVAPGVDPHDRLVFGASPGRRPARGGRRGAAGRGRSLTALDLPAHPRAVRGRRRRASPVAPGSRPPRSRRGPALYPRPRLRYPAPVLTRPSPLARPSCFSDTSAPRTPKERRMNPEAAGHTLPSIAPRLRRAPAAEAGVGELPRPLYGKRLRAEVRVGAAPRRAFPARDLRRRPRAGGALSPARTRPARPRGFPRRLDGRGRPSTCGASWRASWSTRCARRRRPSAGPPAIRSRSRRSRKTLVLRRPARLPRGARPGARRAARPVPAPAPTARTRARRPDRLRARAAGAGGRSEQSGGGGAPRWRPGPRARSIRWSTACGGGWPAAGWPAPVAHATPRGDRLDSPRCASYTDARCLGTRSPPGFPERPERVALVVAELERDGRFEIVRGAEPPELEAAIEAVHDRRVRRALPTAPSRAATASSTPPTTRSAPAASKPPARRRRRRVAALDESSSGRSPRAFAAVRPPGHHAERDRAMGFCFFNNAAVAAQRAHRPARTWRGSRSSTSTSTTATAPSTCSRSAPTSSTPASTSGRSTRAPGRRRSAAAAPARARPSTCRCRPARATTSTGAPSTSGCCRRSTLSRPSC